MVNDRQSVYWCQSITISSTRPLFTRMNLAEIWWLVSRQISPDMKYHGNICVVLTLLLSCGKNDYSYKYKHCNVNHVNVVKERLLACYILSTGHMPFFELEDPMGF